LRVLLVDDNTVNQKVGLRLLSKLGYQADLACNGLEAAEAAQRRPYDLIIMDVQMPFMDGLEATRLIRASARTAPPGSPAAHRPCIVAMTAGVLRGDRERCLEAGMDDYLAKPVRLEDLQGIIERCASRPQGQPNPAATVTPAAAPALAPAPAPLAPAAVAPPSTPPAMVAPEASRPQFEPESPPVDMERLIEFTGGDPQSTHELVGLYLQQTAEQLQKMQAALAASSAPDLQRAAHSCAGSSATCGMNALVPPLRELERLAHEQQLAGASRQLEQASREFARIQAFLTVYLKSLDSPACG
jgi:CheY-like chemotaxis protein